MLSSRNMLTRTGAVPIVSKPSSWAARQIDDPPVDKRPAIVDAQAERAAVLQVGHLDDARQRQRLVRRRQLVHVVDLIIRRQLLVEARAIPRGEAGFVVAVIGPRGVPYPLHLIRLDSVDRLSALMSGMVFAGELQPRRGATGQRQAERHDDRQTPDA